MRAVCSRTPGQQPEAIVYHDKTVQRHLREVQKKVVDSWLPQLAFPSDQGWSETFNQAARQYCTVLKNNLASNLGRWQRRVLSLQLEQTNHKGSSKALKAFLVTSTVRSINGESPVPRNMYKTTEVQNYALTQDTAVQHLVNTHLEKFRAVDSLRPQYPSGVANSTAVENNLHCYIAYALYLQQEMEMFEQTQPRPKAPFVVIPQLTVKTRCITFGKEQVTELVKFLAKDTLEVNGERGCDWVTREFQPDQFPSIIDREAGVLERKQEKLLVLQQKLNDLAVTDKQYPKLAEKVLAQQKRVDKGCLAQAKRKNRPVSQKRKHALCDQQHIEKTNKRAKPTVAKSTWRSMYELVRQKLFHVPERLSGKWTGVVTTDGVRAMWHCRRAPKPKPHTKTAPRTGTVRVVRALQPRHYGVHQEEAVFENRDLNMIAVDPGHAVLISAVRFHVQLSPQRIPTGASKRTVKRLNAYDELGRSRFKLTNREWAQNCGRLNNERRHLRLRSRLQLQPVIDDLAKYSSKTSSSDRYFQHVRARLRTAQQLVPLLTIKSPRRWKFEIYQKEQHAVKKLSVALLDGLAPNNTLVVWGNGGFGPTSKGHASAPNQKLQKQLARYVPLVVGSEYRSSKTSSCHLAEVNCLKIAGQRTRVTTLQCRTCNRCLSRDFNAAHVIGEIFKDQQVRSSAVLPCWIQRSHLSNT
jgi:putative hemolysin